MGRLLRTIGIICLTAALLGCVPQFAQRPGMVIEEEPITLRIAWWGGEFRNNATIEVINQYEQLNPHVNIEYEYSSFNEYWRKMAPLAAGNALPDIIQMDISYLAQYSSLQLLEDLSPYAQRGLLDTKDVDKQQLDSGSIDGKVYGLSLGVNALMSIYDPEVLQANGIEFPTDAWTWDDFDQMGKHIQGRGIYLGTYLTPEQFFAYYLRQHGAKLYAEDGTRLGYENDDLFVEYFGLMQRLAQDKLIFAPDIWTSDIGKPDNDPFYLGEALFSWGYSNQFISTTERYGKPLSIAPMPGPNNSDGLFLKPGMFFSIAGNSRQKEEAAKFISFFVNDLDANLLLKGERGVPVSSSVREQMRRIVEPEQAQVFDYIDWVADHSSPMDAPDPVGSSEVTAVLRELYDLLLFGKLTADDAAQQFRERANAILARSET